MTSPRARIAAVDLQRLTVSYYSVRLPAIGAHAIVLGRSRIALGGEPSKRPFFDAGSRSTGIFILDLRRRSVKWIDRDHGAFTLATGRLWAFRRALGVAAYDLEGRLQFTLLPDREVSDVQVTNGYAYLRTFDYWSRDDLIHVVDLASGNVVQSRRGMKGVQLLIGSGSRG